MTPASAPHCRLCQAEHAQVFIDTERCLEWGQAFIRCGVCNNGYLWPDLPPQRHSEFYRTHYRRLFVAESAKRYDEAFVTSLRLREISRCRLASLRGILPPNPRVLEVGSGFGAFLAEVWRSYPDAELHAIEPDCAHRAVALQDAPVRFYADLAELPAGLAFDAIILFHSLEHLVDPLETLTDLRARLSAGGHIVIEVPDCGAPWSSWTNVHPAHLSYFTASGLDRITASIGLAPVSTRPVLPDTLWRILAPVPPTPLAAASVDDIARFDAQLAAARWTRPQALRKALRQIAVALLGPARVGQVQRWRFGRRVDASLIAALTPPHVETRRTLLGAPVDLLSFDASLALLTAAIAGQRPPLRVGDVNVAKLMQIRDDPALLHAIAGCGLICADGMGIVWAGRWLGVPIPERVTGIDLMQGLLAVCAENGWRPYLLGAEAAVLAEASMRLQKRFPALVLAGQHHGFFTPDEEAGLVETIRASRSDCLIVGMGSPRQELFLERYFTTLGVPVAMGVGGSFDVLAGKFKRAPRWMQRFGLEWVARLAQDPRRLARRYLTSNSRLLGLILIAKLTRRRR